MGSVCYERLDSISSCLFPIAFHLKSSSRAVSACIVISLLSISLMEREFHRTYTLAHLIDLHYYAHCVVCTFVVVNSHVLTNLVHIDIRYYLELFK